MTMLRTYPRVVFVSVSDRRRLRRFEESLRLPVDEPLRRTLQ